MKKALQVEGTGYKAKRYNTEEQSLYCEIAENSENVKRTFVIAHGACNSMHLPNIKDIPRNAFTWAEFSELTFDKDKVTSIGENSLMGANARNVIDLINVTVIPNNAF